MTAFLETRFCVLILQPVYSYLSILACLFWPVYFILSVIQGSLAACEFLLLNGAKVDVKDHDGRTALHHASRLGHTG